MEAAYERALRLLAIRPRGHRELARALEERGFEKRVIGPALERAEREGWLDDLDAASSLAQSQSGRYGRSRIARELSARGFSTETVAAAVAELPAEREEDALSRAFARVSRSLAGLEAEKRRRRVWSALVRRGFRPEAISAIMKGSNEID